MSKESSSSPGDGRDTPEAIMDATYSALCKHGFADLTMQDIADETAKSKASLHYHFDTKEALLLAFLDHLYEAFTEEYARAEGANAVERLVAFVDDILCRTDPQRAQAFQTALLEIRAQAPYSDPYREKLVRFDAFLRDRVEAILTDGIEEGTVREDVDPADTAAFIATLVDGVNTRRVTVGETDGGCRRTFVDYVQEHVVAPEADVVVADSDPEHESGPAADTTAGARHDGQREDTPPDTAAGGEH